MGIGGKDQKVEFSALELFHFARTITGRVAGSLDPDRDLPRLYEHAIDGTLDLGRSSAGRRTCTASTRRSTTWRPVASRACSSAPTRDRRDSSHGHGPYA
ncbi:hypothetical protein [Nonomuraea aridisoli]|uniref:hypothetical protein n=1 Tax=Nonomuraea aridisoli TaxID=2070368 RepID=UPI0015E8C9FC|nr:hypothetical protein [Nonomuraea aridisoli]